VHDPQKRESLSGRNHAQQDGGAMNIDISFLPALAAAFLLIFARVGAMVMMMPGIGESNLPARVRLAIVLVLTAVMLPAHQKAYTVDLNALGPVLLLLFQELMIGAILGLTARLAISALQTAGAVVAQQMGLGFVTAVDPTQGQQGMLVGNFLTLLGITLVFATDLHHLVIEAINDSYTIFKPGEMPLVGDAAKHITNVIATSFRIGIQLSAPFLAFGLLFNLGLGVLSRLMPQMQVFFIGLPLSILLGMLLLILVVGAMMGTFVDYLSGVLSQLAPAG
jgi:flagellar biosynthetic protein FliR